MAEVPQAVVDAIRNALPVGSKPYAEIAAYAAIEALPSVTPQDPDEGVTQADLARGEELDEKFGWSHTAEDAKRLRKQAAEVHADPDEEPEWPVVWHFRDKELGMAAGFTTAPNIARSNVAYEMQTYYPASHPALLSPDEARLVVAQLGKGLGSNPACEALARRLKAYAEKGTQP